MRLIEPVNCRRFGGMPPVVQAVSTLLSHEV